MTSGTHLAIKSLTGAFSGPVEGFTSNLLRLAQYPLHAGMAAADLQANGAGRQPQLPKFPDFSLHCGLYGFAAAELLLLPFRDLDAFPLALADDGALEFREAAQQLELQGLQGRCLPVRRELEVFLQEAHGHALCAKFLEDLLEIAKVPGQTVDGMDYQLIPGPGIAQAFFQPWLLPAPAAGLVLVQALDRNAIELAAGF